MRSKGVWLEDLTWFEAKARFDSGAAVVIPIGASSKAHGPHLPLKTDALTARVEVRVKKRTARGEQGEVAIAFGSLDELNGLLDKLGLPGR